MPLSTIKGENFRNLSNFDLTFSPTLNLISGLNASGKSSLLESIYYLSTARSFRTSNTSNLIQHGHEALTLFGRFSTSNKTIPVGIKKTTSSLNIRISGNNINLSSTLARNFPVITINPDTQSLLTSGPSLRRKLIDWGVFHVEHDYLKLQTGYMKLLKQRNALLKSKKELNQLNVWNIPYSQYCTSINDLRKKYIDQLLLKVNDLIIKTRILPEIDIKYLAGIPEHILSSDQIVKFLEENRNKDIRYGFSTAGPHKADIDLRCGKKHVQEILSRGQQKLLATIILIAQTSLLTEKGIDTIMLMDDTHSELDKNSFLDIFKMALNTQAQIFLTSTDTIELDYQKRVFHVEHGFIKEVV